MPLRQGKVKWKKKPHLWPKTSLKAKMQLRKVCNCKKARASLLSWTLTSLGHQTASCQLTSCCLTTIPTRRKRALLPTATASPDTLVVLESPQEQLHRNCLKTG